MAKKTVSNVENNATVVDNVPIEVKEVVSDVVDTPNKIVEKLVVKETVIKLGIHEPVHINADVRITNLGYGDVAVDGFTLYTGDSGLFDGAVKIISASRPQIKIEYFN